jgi:D-alanyl-D-alanine carboxypeptidase/D-alanyl-D-alanine-endopeptidase (penicillin-binding protein 4)
MRETVRLGIGSLLLLVSAHAFAELPSLLQRIVTNHAIPEHTLGIVVQEVGASEPLLSVNADVPRNPASAIKILPTLAALEELGPAWTWRTEVYLDGELRNGTLDGDVVFKGHGDPYLVVEEFWKLVQMLRRSGLEDITGDMVIDNTYFDLPPEDPGAFDKRPFHTYNVLPDAFLVNFKAVQFHFNFGGNNGVEILTEPSLPNLAIDNRLDLVSGRCGGYQIGIAMTVPDPVKADKVVFEGRVPRACRSYSLGRSLLTAQSYAYGVFKSLWEQSGGSIAGGVRSGLAPQKKPFITFESRPLGEIIRLVNKHSNNVMTRQILLTLGAELLGEPGTQEKGETVITRYLQKRGIDTTGLVLDNGAGLSREARVTPRMLADVLLYAQKRPYAAEFISSLAIVGVDGTARNRLRRREETGHAHVKTGTIDHVSSLAGYVHARSGRQFVIAGIVNHTNVHFGVGKELWDALVQWAYRQ